MIQEMLYPGRALKFHFRLCETLWNEQHFLLCFLQFTMEEFYRQWFHLQENENPEYRQLQNESETEGPGTESESESENNNERGQMHAHKDEGSQMDDLTSEIVYEDADLKLYVQKGVFKRQKMFKLSDQMYYFKMETKSETTPLLSSILNFLHAGFLFILQQLRKRIRPDEHSVCYMTLFQRPMINGLNSGSYDLHSKGIKYDTYHLI